MVKREKIIYICIFVFIILFTAVYSIFYINFKIDESNSYSDIETTLTTVTGSSNDSNYDVKYETEKYYYLNNCPAGQTYNYDINIDKLYIYMGSQNTGGYYLDIDEIYSKGDSLYIKVNEVSPSIDDMVSESFTCPYLVLTLHEKYDHIYIGNGEKAYSKITSYSIE